MATVPPSDEREIIERALRRVFDAARKGEPADDVISQAAAAIEQRRISITSARSMADDTAKLLAEFDALGGGRSAASIVARRHCDGCPHKLEMIAQRIRKANRARKASPVRSAPKTSCKTKEWNL